MRTLKSLLLKDFLIIIRDKAGLMLLLLMPIVLVFVMTGMQDGAMGDGAKNRISIIMLNSDQDSIGNTIFNSLKESDVFEIELLDNQEANQQNRIEKLVQKGDYQVGIYIPENTTQKIKKNVKISVSAAFAGIPSKSISDKMDSISITIFLDPTTNSTFRSTLMNYIHLASAQIENKFIFSELSEEVKSKSMIPLGDFDLSSQKGIYIDKKIASSKNDKAIIKNVAQHNVPAWTIFAIFFIVVSLSGNIIKERNDGSFARLMAMPCSYFSYLLSKIIIYLFVCIVQFLLICMMGIWILPLAGLPAFEPAGYFWQLLLIVICSAIAAIAFGILISSCSSSYQQAASFGSVSVVILAAIGGLWVPVFLMPKFLAVLSKISPLNWGLDAFYDFLLRDNPSSAFLKCLVLLIFAAFCFVISLSVKKSKI